MIAPLIVTPIALWFGWHGVFIATGFFGAMWLLLWRKVGATVDRGMTFTRERLPFKSSALWAYILPLRRRRAAAHFHPLRFVALSACARFGWSQATLGKVL